MTIDAVFFDVGEVLVDETREYGAWADWLGIPRHTFSAVFGAVIAQGRDYREAFEVFQPDFDLATERKRRVEANQPEWFGEDDLYPDVRPALSALREEAILVGIAGNQTGRAERILRGLNLPADVVCTSDSLAAEKPSRTFFERMLATTGMPPQRVLYVGDRLDNDIRPASKFGMHTAVMRRGPWGHILSDAEAKQHCLFELNGLTELPELVHRHNSRAG